MSATGHQPLDTSVPDAVTHALRGLSTDDICHHATYLRATADDLGCWPTTIEVDRRLRDTRLSRRVAGCAPADADSIAVMCEMVAPSDPHRAIGPSAAG